MRQLRIDEDKKQPVTTPQSSGSGGAGAAGGGGGAATSPLNILRPAAEGSPISIDEKEVEKFWQKHDKEKRGVIRFALLGEVLRAVLDSVVAKKQAIRKKAGKETESLEKAKHEIQIETLVNRYTALRTDGTIKFADFKTQFFKDTLPDLLARMARMD